MWVTVVELHWTGPGRPPHLASFMRDRYLGMLLETKLPRYIFTRHTQYRVGGSGQMTSLGPALLHEYTTCS